MVYLNRLLVLLWAFILFACVPKTLEKSYNPEVDDLFAEWNSENSPGCALGVVKDGELVYARGYGQADLEHEIAITPTSVFYIASVSKQFITMSILLLEEQGKLDLDDEIQKYLPDFPEYDAPLTIRHFIHHTSGVRDYLTLWSLAGNDYMDHIDEDAVYSLIKRQKTLNFSPGEKYLYSNSCYFMLAMIIEKASGQSLKAFADEQIFQPLGMKNSHFHDDHLHLVKNRAFSYAPGDNGINNLIMRFDLVGSGGLYSNIEDLYLWDQNFYDNSLGLGREDLIIQMQEDGVLNNGESTGYAFALWNDNYRGLRTISHGGSLAGYRTQIMRFPDQEFSVILLSNDASFKAQSMAQKVAEVYLGELMEPDSGESADVNSDKPEIENPVTVDDLSVYVGTYYSEELDVDYKVLEDKGSLMYSVKYNAPEKLTVKRKDVFANRIELVFLRDNNNAISGFEINAGRVQNLAFTKVE